MRITLTSINFNYDDGKGGTFESVDLNFTASGATFNPSGHVTVSKEEYETAGGGVDELKALVKDKMVQEIQNAE